MGKDGADADRATLRSFKIIGIEHLFVKVIFLRTCRRINLPKDVCLQSLMQNSVWV